MDNKSVSGKALLLPVACHYCYGALAPKCTVAAHPEQKIFREICGVIFTKTKFPQVGRISDCLQEAGGSVSANSLVCQNPEMSHIHMPFSGLN